MEKPAGSKITLILGGARSGKSSLAEKIAAHRAGEGGVLYVATLQPFDSEMEERVRSHRAARPGTWRTVEAPFRLGQEILSGLKAEKVVLVDCLTVWVSNLLLAESGELEQAGGTGKKKQEPKMPDQPADNSRLEALIKAELEAVIQKSREGNKELVLVSNEVGLGLVPPYPLGRVYRDLLGRVNQYLAARADEVILVVAGLPVDLKRLQAQLGFEEKGPEEIGREE